jgi:hypothetical protein
MKRKKKIKKTHDVQRNNSVSPDDPSVIPNNWTPALDQQYYRDWYGENETEPSTMRSSMSGRLESALCEYNIALALAVQSLMGPEAPEAGEALQHLWPEAKLQMLRLLSKRCGRELRDQISGEIDYCEEGMDFVGSIFTRLVLAPNNVWFRELIFTRDWIISMVYHIETTFKVNVRAMACA